MFRGFTAGARGTSQEEEDDDSVYSVGRVAAAVVNSNQRNGKPIMPRARDLYRLNKEPSIFRQQTGTTGTTKICARSRVRMFTRTSENGGLTFAKRYLRSRRDHSALFADSRSPLDREFSGRYLKFNAYRYSAIRSERIGSERFVDRNVRRSTELRFVSHGLLK